MDQDRPIEKLLGRAAKSRRDKAPTRFELHPATRRVLQGEVARTFPPSASESSSRGFLAFFSLRRFAIGAGALAIFIVAGLFIWFPPHRQPQTQTLALNQPSRQEAVKEPNAAPAPIVQAADQNLVDRAKRNISQDLAAVDNRQQNLNYETKDALISANSMSAKSGIAKEELAVDKMQKPAESQAAPLLAGNDSSSAAAGPAGFGGGAAAASPDGRRLPQTEVLLRSRGLAAPASTPPTSSAAVGGLASSQPAQSTETLKKDADSSATLTLADASRDANSAFFVQQPQSTRFLNKAKVANAVPSNTTNVVLASFRVEQEGTTMRVIDYDGSVYTGSVTPAAGTSAYGLSPASKTAARPVPARRFDNESVAPLPSVANPSSTTLSPASPGPAPVINFRVAGTNRTLKQLVVFTGTFSHITTNVLINGPTPPGASASSTVWLGDTTVAGRAVINNAQPVEVQAVPTSSPGAPASTKSQ